MWITIADVAVTGPQIGVDTVVFWGAADNYRSAPTALAKRSTSADRSTTIGDRGNRSRSPPQMDQ